MEGYFYGYICSAILVKDIFTLEYFSSVVWCQVHNLKPTLMQKTDLSYIVSDDHYGDKM